jgi:hypothetical protein
MEETVQAQKEQILSDWRDRFNPAEITLLAVQLNQLVDIATTTLKEQNGRFTDWHLEQGRMITELRAELVNYETARQEDAEHIATLTADRDRLAGELAKARKIIAVFAREAGDIFETTPDEHSLPFRFTCGELRHAAAFLAAHPEQPK